MLSIRKNSGGIVAHVVMDSVAAFMDAEVRKMQEDDQDVIVRAVEARERATGNFLTPATARQIVNYQSISNVGVISQSNPMYSSATADVGGSASDNSSERFAGLERFLAWFWAWVVAKAFPKRTLAEKELMVYLYLIRSQMFLLIFCTICFGGVMMGALEVWNQSTQPWDPVFSIYWAVCTACSIGFGDIYPQTRAGKIFCIFYPIIAVTSMATAFGTLSALHV